MLVAPLVASSRCFKECIFLRGLGRPAPADTSATLGGGLFQGCGRLCGREGLGTQKTARNANHGPGYTFTLFTIVYSPAPQLRSERAGKVTLQGRETCAHTFAQQSSGLGAFAPTKPVVLISQTAATCTIIYSDYNYTIT